MYPCSARQDATGIIRNAQKSVIETLKEGNIIGANIFVIM
jgi:hypothetical protein